MHVPVDLHLHLNVHVHVNVYVRLHAIAHVYVPVYVRIHVRVHVPVNLLHNATSPAALQQSCQWETFQASCTSPDHVIIMQRAQYGRMRRGRCVKRDFGYIGCAANVLSLADQLCSGRTKCYVPVYATFGHLRPCSELESYFEATFACVEGTNDLVCWKLLLPAAAIILGLK